jgi:hypothetical protein
MTTNNSTVSPLRQRMIEEMAAVDTAKSGATPEQINPGLAPSMNALPRNRS